MKARGESSRAIAFFVVFSAIARSGLPAVGANFMRTSLRENRERLAGGPGGGNERPWSPHGMRRSLAGCVRQPLRHHSRISFYTNM